MLHAFSKRTHAIQAWISTSTLSGHHLMRSTQQHQSRQQDLEPMPQGLPPPVPAWQVATRERTEVSGKRTSTRPQACHAHGATQSHPCHSSRGCPSCLKNMQEGCKEVGRLPGLQAAWPLRMRALRAAPLPYQW